MKTINQFTDLYSKSITLRFEAQPIGETEKNFREHILASDLDRAKKYKEAKLIIDNYHRWHIESSLKNFKLDEGQLNDFYDTYNAKSDNREKELETIQKPLRKQISDVLLKNKKELFGKELIHKLIPQWLELSTENNDGLEIIECFNKFTTYFTGFNNSRESIYTSEKKKNTITYRLIHENLPKFVDNINLFKRISQTEIAEKFEVIRKELNLDVAPDEIFSMTYYNKLLTQSGITLFNTVIGGISDKSQTKHKGLNEYINEYNQRHPDARIPKFKPLHKQILSIDLSTSFVEDTFDNSKDVINAINNAYKNIHEQVLLRIESILGILKQSDLSLIYIENGTDLTQLSHNLFGNYDAIHQNFIHEYESSKPRKPKESVEKYIEKQQKAWKKNSYITLQYIDNMLTEQGDSNNTITYFTGEKLMQLLKKISDAHNSYSQLINEQYSQELKADQAAISLIKELLDSIKELQHFIKPLCKGENYYVKDDEFYNEFIPVYHTLDENITRLYNKVRNYVTQKPYSTDKIKLNFENNTLMGGWDLNKEQDNTTIILRKDGLYYLAIMNKEHKKSFAKKPLPCEGDCYEKMEYKQISSTAGIGGFIRKCRGTAQDCGWVCPENCLNSEGNVIINDKEVTNNLIEIIDCQKDYFNIYEKDGFCYKDYDFKFKPSNEYNSLSEFYKDVQEQAYKITFTPVSVSYINELVASNKLYLFKLYNKDFSPHSKGLPNLHTMYWKMLFDEENLANVKYALNGNAELFFRQASIEGKITHPANVPIQCKSEENKGQERTFEYDLIKNRRYTKDKFQFHVPITLCFKNKEISTAKAFNEHINNNYIPHARHIIGIDRGERHLLYITVIDMKGKIVEQFSLNDIINRYNGKEYHTDYHKKLQERETERQKARESWHSIENIKELKEGYLSQVVHKIVQLVLKYDAIIVMEDLDKAFKNNRLKIEKSVYQKFEDMLINKLSYVVDKSCNKNESCGLLNAPQLTYIPDNKSTHINQCGIIFYIPAWCTSKIDPVTGFVNKINTQYTNIAKARELFSKFADIHYNHEEQYFEFHIDDYTTMGGIEDTQKKWILTTQGNRIETTQDATTRRYGILREVNLTEEFMTLLKDGINGDIREYILQQEDATFFKRLLHCTKLMLQMRNSLTGTETDYLISPVKQPDGTFFNSDNEKRKGRDDDGKWISNLPVDADANGAYNIARKGLMATRNILSGMDSKETFAISNKLWLQFVQQNNV